MAAFVPEGGVHFTILYSELETVVVILYDGENQYILSAQNSGLNKPLGDEWPCQIAIGLVTGSLERLIGPVHILLT